MKNSDEKMIKLEFGYGSGVQYVEVPQRNLIGVLQANEIADVAGGAEAVERALENPVASPKLRELTKRGKKIAIITSDISRPMPTYDVLPAVLDELYRADVKPEDITVVFALGTHRKHTEEEKERLAGQRCYKEVRCVDSDPDDCIRLGVTSRGTPVDITRIVAEADFRICLGNVEFH